jgi:hypothetical protein
VEKHLFLALDIINMDDKSAWGNGKRPSGKDFIGRGKSCYNIHPKIFPLKIFTPKFPPNFSLLLFSLKN